MNTYRFSKYWFEFASLNEDVNSNHTAMVFFIIDLANRLNWAEQFGLPTLHTQETLKMRSYKTYKKTLDDLVYFGVIKILQKSANQYTSNIICFDTALVSALVKNTEPTTKASIEADTKATPKQSRHNKTITNYIKTYYKLIETDKKDFAEIETENISSIKLLENLDEKFSVYIYGILKSNSEVEFKDEWQLKKSCYYQLVLNSSHFHKIMQKSNIQEEKYKALLLEFFRHKSTQLSVKWKSISDLFQNAINYINKKIKDNGNGTSKPNEKNTVAYIQQQQMREPARDFGEL